MSLLSLGVPIIERTDLGCNRKSDASFHSSDSTLEAGARYCPHFLGGGIGLAAFAELLAAVGGDGVLAFDINANSLSEAFRLLVGQGHWQFVDRSGLRLGLGRAR